MSPRDLGICLVLFALPAAGFAVAIGDRVVPKETRPSVCDVVRRDAVRLIPIRNFLPGAPPPGAWVRQALVIWVLIALVGAMGLYMITWYRQSG